MHMQQLGADVIEAAIACLGGHRMTPDLAALCITTYWRRYSAIAQFQENRGAAITIQARARRAPEKTPACSGGATNPFFLPQPAATLSAALSAAARARGAYARC